MTPLLPSKTTVTDLPARFIFNYAAGDHVQTGWFGRIYVNGDWPPSELECSFEKRSCMSKAVVMMTDFRILRVNSVHSAGCTL